MLINCNRKMYKRGRRLTLSMRIVLRRFIRLESEYFSTENRIRKLLI